jgi:hypothetical membrane protein
LLTHSIALSPWFDWHRDSLSSLGVSASASWFHASVHVQGLAMAVLALGLWFREARTRLGTLGTATLILGALAVSLVGVFPRNLGPVHLAVAATYFVATPIGLAIVGAAMWSTGGRLHAVLTVCAGAAALLGIAATPHKGFAVPELVAGLFVGVWVFATGMGLLLSAESLPSGWVLPDRPSPVSENGALGSEP